MKNTDNYKGQTMPEQGITITQEALKEMMVEAIKAARAPNSVEQMQIDAQVRESKQANENRLKLSQSVADEAKQRKWNRNVCTHKRADGTTRLTHIQEPNGPGYLLCLWNQCKIRPGAAPKNYQGDDIYDTDKFNELIQGVRSSSEILI